ncbi:hypothetical protein [Longivirga aurantiaca]|uniref:DUF5666 domain-containing protein n=1 Tax=Longivirga aurantiaca TaxID=1837743 RepID=A0ABW1T537_9ACTN
MDQDRPGLTPPPAGSTPGDLPAAQPETGTTEVLASAQRGRRIGTGVLVAAVGIAALGVAGATYAAASDPSPSASGRGSSEGPPAAPGDGDGDRDGDGGHRGDGQGGPDRGGHGPRGGFPGAVHGTFVVPNQDGTGYQTMQMQHGTVTAVSATSISVTSADGFTATYVVDAGTKINRDGAIADITADADVMVMGIVDGSTVTAERVVDTAAFGAGGERDHGGTGPGGLKSGEATPSAAA